MQRAEILRGHDVFREILTKGKRIRGIHVRAFLLTVDAACDRGMPVRIGFVVSKRIRSASNRNRIRRLMREAYRKQKERLLVYAQEHAKRYSLILMYRENDQTDIKKLHLADFEEDVYATITNVISEQ